MRLIEGFAPEIADRVKFMLRASTYLLLFVPQSVYFFSAGRYIRWATWSARTAGEQKNASRTKTMRSDQGHSIRGEHSSTTTGYQVHFINAYVYQRQYFYQRRYFINGNILPATVVYQRLQYFINDCDTFFNDYNPSTAMFYKRLYLKDPKERTDRRFRTHRAESTGVSKKKKQGWGDLIEFPLRDHRLRTGVCFGSPLLTPGNTPATYGRAVPCTAAPRQYYRAATTKKKNSVCGSTLVSR